MWGEFYCKRNEYKYIHNNSACLFLIDGWLRFIRGVERVSDRFKGVVIETVHLQRKKRKANIYNINDIASTYPDLIDDTMEEGMGTIAFTWRVFSESLLSLIFALEVEAKADDVLL